MTLYIEKAVLFPLNYFNIFVENQLTIYLWFYFWTLSVSLLFISIFLLPTLSWLLYFYSMKKGERLPTRKEEEKKGTFLEGSGAIFHMAKVKTSALIQNNKVHPSYSFDRLFTICCAFLRSLCTKYMVGTV